MVHLIHSEKISISLSLQKKRIILKVKWNNQNPHFNIQRLKGKPIAFSLSKQPFFCFVLGRVGRKCFLLVRLKPK